MLSMKTNETGTTIGESASLVESSAQAVCLPTRKHRNNAIDALRGLVMILMALDHTREFFHVGAMSFQPEDLTRTTAAIFFTRWITHICAPVFFFTTGLGAFCLAWARSHGKPDVFPCQARSLARIA
jgi:uncharacterized membrane protein